MIAMRPIDEADVIALLNDGRFDGPVEGYVMSDGAEYLGHALFWVQDGVTTVLDTGVEDILALDGIVRACVAAGQNRGAGRFLVNRTHPPLTGWWARYCKGLEGPAPVERIFGTCGGG